MCQINFNFKFSTLYAKLPHDKLKSKLLFKNQKIKIKIPKSKIKILKF